MERSKNFKGKIGNDHLFGSVSIDLVRRHFYCELRNSTTMEVYSKEKVFPAHRQTSYEQRFAILGRSSTTFTVVGNLLVVEDPSSPGIQIEVPIRGFNNVEDRFMALTKLQQKEILHNAIWTHCPPKITFTTHAQVSTLNQWTIVPNYSIQVNFPKSFSAVQISLHIPFSGNNVGDSRSRVQLLYDGVPVCDSTMYSGQPFELMPLHMQALVPDVTQGMHSFEVNVHINKGTVYIPFYNPNATEATTPAIFAKYSFIGYP